MNTPKDKSNSKVVTSTLVVLVMLLQTLRLATSFLIPTHGHSPTSHELYNMTGQPITEDRAEHDLARLRDLGPATSSTHEMP